MQVPNCVAHPSRTQVQKGRPTDEGQAEGRIPDMDKWRRDQFGFVPMTLEATNGHDGHVLSCRVTNGKSKVTNEKLKATNAKVNRNGNSPSRRLIPESTERKPQNFD
jgi:hypothetical protein